VAIVNTRLVSVGTPAELISAGSSRSLEVRVRHPLGEPERVFGRVRGVQGWRNGRAPGLYVVDVQNLELDAADVARAVVRAGGSLVRLCEVETSLEDAYLALLEDGP
jgi:hypothetical protein